MADVLAEIQASDPELWRTKQLNDFSSGIWAQCFGRTYSRLLMPLLWVRGIAQIVGMLLLVVLLLLILLCRRPARSEHGLGGSAAWLR